MCGNITHIHNEQLLNDSDVRVGRTAVLNPGFRVIHLQVTLHRYYVSFHTMNLSISILMQTVCDFLIMDVFLLRRWCRNRIHRSFFLSPAPVCPKAQEMKNN